MHRRFAFSAGAAGEGGWRLDSFAPRQDSRRKNVPRVRRRLAEEGQARGALALRLRLGKLHEFTRRRRHNPIYAGGSQAGVLLGGPAKLGRFVMLAPPNKGARLASFCGPMLRRCFPAIDQLAARPDSFVNSLPEPASIEVGVIDAGIDLLVGAGNTSLACQRDHIALRATHTLLAFQRQLAAEVLHFLATGRFSPEAVRRPCRLCGRNRP